MNRQRLKRLLIGLLLLTPLLVLILFTPTQAPYCNGDYDGLVCRGVWSWRDNGVVLEVIIRFVMWIDWAASAINTLKILAVLLAIIMGFRGIGYIFNLVPPKNDDNDPTERDR